MKRLITLMALMGCVAAWAGAVVIDAELEYLGNITEQDFSNKGTRLVRDEESFKLSRIPPEVKQSMEDSLSKYKMKAGDGFLFFCYDSELSSDVAVLLRITTVNKNGTYSYSFYAVQQGSPQQASPPQELKVTRSEVNNGLYPGIGNDWPSGKDGAQWNSLITQYNLVPLASSNPFEQGDGLAERIRKLALNHLFPSIDITPALYTVYLTMGNRKFVCFVRNSYGDYYTWTYESKN